MSWSTTDGAVLIKEESPFLAVSATSSCLSAINRVTTSTTVDSVDVDENDDEYDDVVVDVDEYLVDDDEDVGGDKKNEWLNTKICKNGLNVLLTLHEGCADICGITFETNVGTW